MARTVRKTTPWNNFAGQGGRKEYQTALNRKLRRNWDLVNKRQVDREAH